MYLEKSVQVKQKERKKEKQNFFKAADSQSCKHLKCQYTQRSTPLQESSDLISFNKLTNTKPKDVSSTFFALLPPRWIMFLVAFACVPVTLSVNMKCMHPPRSSRST